MSKEVREAIRRMEEDVVRSLRVPAEFVQDSRGSISMAADAANIARHYDTMLELIYKDPLVRASIRDVIDMMSRPRATAPHEFYVSLYSFARADRIRCRNLRLSMRSKLWHALQARGAIT